MLWHNVAIPCVTSGVQFRFICTLCEQPISFVYLTKRGLVESESCICSSSLIRKRIPRTLLRKVDSRAIAAAVQIAGGDVTWHTDTGPSVTHSFLRDQRTHGENKQMHSRGGRRRRGKQRQGWLDSDISVPSVYMDACQRIRCCRKRSCQTGCLSRHPSPHFKTTRFCFSGWRDLNYPAIVKSDWDRVLVNVGCQRCQLRQRIIGFVVMTWKLLS